MRRAWPGLIPRHKTASSARHECMTPSRTRNDRFSILPMGTTGSGGGATAAGGGGAVATGRSGGFGAAVLVSAFMGFAGVAGIGAATAAGFGAAGGGGAIAAGAAAGGGGGEAAAAGGGGFGIAALTAFWQVGDRLAMWLLRQSNASLPPGRTLEQFAM